MQGNRESQKMTQISANNQSIEPDAKKQNSKTIAPNPHQNSGAIIFCVISLLLVVLYEPLQTIVFQQAKYIVFQQAKYIDELICLIMLLLTFITIAVSKRVFLYQFEIKILIASLLLLLIGIIPYFGNAPNKIPAGFIDIVVFFKSISIYFTSRIFLRNWEIANWRKILVPFFTIMAILIGLFVMFDKLYNLFSYHDIRFSMQSEALFFGHPSRYSFFWIYCFIVLMPFLIKTNRTFLLFILAMGLLSLRFKYFAFVPFGVVVLFTNNILDKIKVKSPVFIFAIALLLGIMLFSVWEHLQINYYSDKYARSALFRNSFVVAKEFFPFGSGFGTYGSYASGKYYSLLYYKLNMANVYGLSPGNSSFVSDTFWPMVLAQFGYLGLLLYGWILFLIFKGLYLFFRIEQDNAYRFFYLSAILLMVSLVIISSSDSIFVQNSSVMSFIYLACVVNLNKKNLNPANAKNH